LKRAATYIKDAYACDAAGHAERASLKVVHVLRAYGQVPADRVRAAGLGERRCAGVAYVGIGADVKVPVRERVGPLGPGVVAQVEVVAYCVRAASLLDGARPGTGRVTQI
jgi:hypothetical protein